MTLEPVPFQHQVPIPVSINEQVFLDNFYDRFCPLLKLFLAINNFQRTPIQSMGPGVSKSLSETPF